MKKLLLIFSIWLSIPASAQKIHFTDTTNVWRQYITYYNDGLGDPYYHTFSFVRDTLIDGFKYRYFNFIVYGNSSSLENWVREDTVLKKVYIRDVANDSDITLMDYTLNVGDTFITGYDSFNHCYLKFPVQSIDSTLINGIWHKTWHFSQVGLTACGRWEPADVIEGIGCIQSPLFMLERTWIEPPWEKMYCFSNNGTIPPLVPAVDHLNNTTSCTYYPHLSASEFMRSNITKIYPNPANTFLTISSPNQITTIIITNLLGQTLYTQNNNTDKLQIDVSGFPAGIYLIKINGSEVKAFIKQ